MSNLEKLCMVGVFSLFQYTVAFGERPPNSVELCDAYEAMAANDDAKAQMELANCFVLGRGRSKDLKQAEHWLKKASGSGLPMAQNNLGALYIYYWPDKAMQADGVTLLQNAQENGDYSAEFNLAVVHLNGIGTEPSHVKALQLFQNSAENGHQLGTVVMFAVNQFGFWNVERNTEKADIYWRDFYNLFQNYPDDLLQRYINSFAEDKILSEYIFTPEQAKEIAGELYNRAVAQREWNVKPVDQ